MLVYYSTERSRRTCTGIQQEAVGVYQQVTWPWE